MRLTSNRDDNRAALSVMDRSLCQERLTGVLASIPFHLWRRAFTGSPLSIEFNLHIPLFKSARIYALDAAGVHGCRAMDVSTNTSTFKHLLDLRSSRLEQADIIKHVLFHDDDTLWERFLVPLSSNLSDSNGTPGDQELIYKVVVTLRTTCLRHLNEIQAIQAERHWNHENRMMPPLEALFRTIEQETANHCRKTGTYFRAFVRADPTPALLVDPQFYGSNTSTIDSDILPPGFFLVDLPPPKQGVLVDLSDGRAHVHSRQCLALVEVRATSNDLPIPQPPLAHPTSYSKQQHESDSDAWMRMLTQAADHARLLMAGRPSLLSTYALFVCGDMFCIALCDRAGMVVSSPKRLSPAADAIADLECFVRVVLRFTWDASPVELGEDPTIVLSASYTPYQEEYSRYDIGMGCTHDGPHPGFETTLARWTTIGEPFWVSRGSLLGCGTSVWRALDQQTRTPLVLKSSWRILGLRSETQVNKILRSFLRNSGIGQLKGLVLASSGGDVYDSSGRITSVSNRRGGPEEKYKPVHDRVLHRVCFTRFGKPIWQYSSLEEFARAMRDALQAHEFLSRYGILHGDISAGNILIDVDASYEAATVAEPEDIVLKDRDPQNASGFLSDWGLAWFPQDVLDVATSVCRIDSRPLEPDSGDMPVGARMFLATEVLLGLSDNRKVVRNRVHELESFEWVILFAVYRQFIESANDGTEAEKLEVSKLTKEFRHIFVDALTTDRVLLLALPSHPATDFFRNIKELVSFVKDVVGSEELLVLLMDVWQDLIYRLWRLSCNFQTPVRPRSHFKNSVQAPLAPHDCMEHQDLIRCLEKLISRSKA